MVRIVKVAATQMAISRDPAANLVRTGREAAATGACARAVFCLRVWRTRWKSLWSFYLHTSKTHSHIHTSITQAKAEKMVRAAAAAGANIILLQVCGGGA
jgi:hypothetical protein